MRLIFLFIAIALAAGAFFVTMHITKEDKKPDTETPVASQASPVNNPVPVVVKPQVIIQKIPTRDVYTARVEIPVGATLRPDMLDIQPWPEHLVLPDMVEADPQKSADIVKMIARSPFQKGEPIIRTKLANEKDPSFIAGELPKGMRLVTIASDAISGDGGFVFPGDHVDVLITHNVVLDNRVEDTNSNSAPPGSAPSGSGFPGGNGAGFPANAAPKTTQVTEVFLSNVRVVAVGAKTAAHTGDPISPPSNVSLEVTATDAQRLRLAESGNGRLSLVLRSIKDAEDPQLARPTGVGDLSRLTPPSYFSVLSDSSQQVVALPAEQAVEPSPAKPFISNSPIAVVRGVRVENVEVTRP